MPQIDLAQLRAVVNRLFDHVMGSRQVKIVDLGAEAYWQVDREQLYDLSKEPRQFDVGSLSDDWEFASKLLDPSWQPLANQFGEIAPLFRRIGEVLGEQLASRGG